MKKFLLLLFSVTILIAIPTTVFAADVLEPACRNANPTNLPAVCRDNYTDASQGDPIVGPNGLMTKAVQILVFILGIVSVFVITIAGLRIVASNGDSNTIATMQKSLIAAVAGLAVAALAQAIVTFVLSRL